MISQFQTALNQFIQSMKPTEPKGLYQVQPIRIEDIQSQSQLRHQTRRRHIDHSIDW